MSLNKKIKTNSLKYAMLNNHLDFNGYLLENKQ